MSYKDLSPKDLQGIFQAIDDGLKEYNGLKIEHLRSSELCRDYYCYHIYGENLDFLLKHSDSHEAGVYSLLNDRNIKPRLSVPKLYDAIPLKANPYARLLAMEYIRQGQNVGDSYNQVDGLVIYKGGSCAEAWKSTGQELSRIHHIYWGNLKSKPFSKPDQTYEGILSNLDYSPKVQDYPVIKEAVLKMKHYLSQMPTCLVHFDLLPINVIVRERILTRADGTKVVHPQATIVDWQTADTLPYILDVARITSHCIREEILDQNELDESHEYCNCDCRNAILDSYYYGIKNRIEISKEEFLRDYQIGRFFEILRMYHQMPVPQPRTSYDRYYWNNARRIAETILGI